MGYANLLSIISEIILYGLSMHAASPCDSGRLKKMTGAVDMFDGPRLHGVG